MRGWSPVSAARLPPAAVANVGLRYQGSRAVLVRVEQHRPGQRRRHEIVERDAAFRSLAAGIECLEGRRLARSARSRARAGRPRSADRTPGTVALQVMASATQSLPFQPLVRWPNRKVWFVLNLRIRLGRRLVDRQHRLAGCDLDRHCRSPMLERGWAPKRQHERSALRREREVGELAFLAR